MNMHDVMVSKQANYLENLMVVIDIADWYASQPKYGKQELSY